MIYPNMDESDKQRSRSFSSLTIQHDAETRLSSQLNRENSRTRPNNLNRQGTSIKAFFGLASSRLGERIAGIFDIRLIWPSCASPVQASSLLFRSGVGFRAH